MDGTQVLEGRTAAILRAVVTDYIRSAEPVGSGTVTRRYRLGVSPATVRSEMAALEELGYLAQPHTSAGRIPTDLGYRFYVDTLPRRPQLAAPHRRAIATFFGDAPPDPQEVLRATAVLLSRLTRYGAVTQPPGAHHVFIGGAANIADAFAQRETVRRVFEALDEEDTVVRLFRAVPTERSRVTVRIGRENRIAAMREASVVIAPYVAAGRPIGVIAVLGPTRMEYRSAMAAVDVVARRLSEVIEPLAG